MIFVTRLDGTELVINSGHIATVEKTPDTVIELTTGERIMVKETIEQVVDRVRLFRRQILEGMCRGPSVHDVTPPSSSTASLEPRSIAEGAEE